MITKSADDISAEVEIHIVEISIAAAAVIRFSFKICRRPGFMKTVNGAAAPDRRDRRIKKSSPTVTILQKTFDVQLRKVSI